MKTITVIKDDEGARSIYVRNDGYVTVFDRDRPADRCRAGWRPGYPDEIDPDIPQRTLRRARFAVDLPRNPGNNESYSPATILMGVDENGQIQATGKIVWIDADREWVVCWDYFWWMPVE